MTNKNLFYKKVKIIISSFNKLLIIFNLAFINHLQFFECRQDAPVFRSHS